MTVKSDLKNTYNNIPYLTFKSLCIVPIQADLCIAEMMTEKEKKWLKEYNKLCYDTMKPLIKDEHVLAWVKKQADKAELL